VRVSVLGTQISKETKMDNSAAMLIKSVLLVSGSIFRFMGLALPCSDGSYSYQTDNNNNYKNK
jgi:hypothetical protein